MITTVTDYRTLIPYVPNVIARWYTDAPTGSVHTVTDHQGTLICIDASGFTALTRHFSALGKEGPEILTSVLNTFFGAMTYVAFQHGGDILKFAGDALWVFFPDDFRPSSFLAGLLAELDKVNSHPDLSENLRLSVHIGAEYGTFHLASLGDPNVRLDAEPFGGLVETVFLACDGAAHNAMLIGPVLAQRCVDSRGSANRKQGLFPVTPHLDVEGIRTKRPTTEPRIVNPSSLVSYVPAELVQRMTSAVSASPLQSEYRDVIVLFGNFEYEYKDEGYWQSSAFACLNEVLKEAFVRIRNVGGSIARIDPYLGGHKLLVLFGAPARGEDDELAALACARHLLDLTDPHFRMRIGLAVGELFCGDVGSFRRREYTVMGDSVNRAVRLMSKAGWNEILLDGELRRRLPGEVTTEETSLQLKGIGNSVICHRLTGVVNSDRVSESVAEVIGQKKKLASLRAFWRDTRQGAGHVIVICGDAGTGKTTLTRRFLAGLGTSEGVIITGRSSLLFGRGWLARKALTALCEMQQDHRVNLAQFASKIVEPHWLPLLNEVLDKTTEDNEWTVGLTAELRTAKTQRLFASLLEAILTSPCALILDDFDRADDYSKSLLLSLEHTMPSLPLLLILVTRELTTAVTSSYPSAKPLKVVSPDDREWRDFFEQKFEDGKRERELFECLLESSKCNPQHIHGFLQGLLERQLLAPNRVSGRWELEAAAARIPVPKDLADVHLSRFDELEEIQRVILKSGSVFGDQFSARVIAETIPDLKSETIQGHLDSLEEAGILVRSSDRRDFGFTHSSMRDAIYACLPEAQLRELHMRYATLLEPRYAGHRPDIPAYHFYRASSWKQAFTYSMAAALAAIKVNSLTESSEFFSHARDALDALGTDEMPPDQVFEFYRELGHFLILEGRYQEAYQVFREWRRFGKRKGNGDESVSASIETAHLMWIQSRYSRSRQFLQKILGSEAIRGNRAKTAKAYSVLAELERRSGQFKKAQDCCQAAIQLAEGINDLQSLSDAHNKLGLALWGEGRLAEAARNFEISLQLAEDRSSIYSQAQTLNNLGIVSYTLGKFLDADRTMIKALDIFRNIGDRRHQAYASGNLANISRILGKLARAEELLLQADAIFEKLGDEHAHQYTVGNLGDLDLVRGRLDVAERRFTDVAAFAQSVGDRELAAECEVRFGDLAFFRADLQDAESRYNRAVNMAKTIGSTEYYLRGCIGLARVHIARRNGTKARDLIDVIKEAAAPENAILVKNEATFLEGELGRIGGDPNRAATCFHQVLKYADDQQIFELALKSAVRLYEVDESSKDSTSRFLHKLIKMFTESNGPIVWQELLDSSYFVHFSGPLRQVVNTKQ